jgi:potassium-dependent mechanosensitive channel
MEELQTQFANGENAAGVLSQQLEVLLVYLYRDSVREQLGLMVWVLVGAFVLVRGLRWLDTLLAERLLKDAPAVRRERVLERILPAVEQLYYPLLVLVAILIFVPTDAGGRPSGILIGLLVLFFAVLAYQLVLVVLYLIFGRKTFARYHHRVLTPLFYTALTIFGLTLVIDVVLVSGIELFTLYDTAITLGRLGSAALVFYIFIVAGWVIQDALSLALSGLDQEEGVRRSVMTVSRFFIVAVGILLTLVALGFNVATLAAIAGGLSLGAGLGLQRIVANFFSGIVLIFEQSLRPGDMIEYNGKVGLVENLNIRATTLRTFDNIDLIIPNENLLTGTLVTHNNEVTRKRLTIKIGVSYDADPVTVRDLLLNTALSHGLILEDPAPFVYFRDYGNSSLDFTLWAWVETLEVRFATENDLRFMIFEALKKHNIGIPYPQRDVHLRWVDADNEGGVTPRVPKPKVKQRNEQDADGDYMNS